MKFEFRRRHLKGPEAIQERVLEILPGLASWSVLGGFLFLSFAKPVAAAVCIILFDFYWLLRLFYLTFFLALAYFRLSLEEGTDWMGKIEEVDHGVRASKAPPKQVSKRNWKERLSDGIHRREIVKLKRSGHPPPAFEEIYHLVIIPLAKEGREVAEPGVERMAGGPFPSERILMVLAVEEWADEEVKQGAWELSRKYRSRFFDFLVVIHPEGLPGEARVKGANVTFAAKEARKHLLEKRIPVEHTIVSCFDADTVVSRDYFACLTYAFMVSPERNRASFQPLPVYHNNIWEAPGFARILEIGSSFFQMTEATQADKLVTFSSHSMSFKALMDVGYWPVDMVSDDSAIFWKSFLHFEGDYRVVPLYVTLSMDVVNAGSWLKTCVQVYKQKRRWAWGVENFPVVMRGFLKSKKIPLYQKFRHGFKLFEGHLAWATWPFLLLVMGWIPAFFAGREFSSTVLYYSAPRIAGTVFNLASLCLVTSIVLSLCLLPKKKVKHSFLKKVTHTLEWFLVPLVAVFLSALPALDAQTRLMLGREMKFWVTEKRKRSVRQF